MDIPNQHVAELGSISSGVRNLFSSSNNFNFPFILHTAFNVIVSPDINSSDTQSRFVICLCYFISICLYLILSWQASFALGLLPKRMNLVLSPPWYEDLKIGYQETSYCYFKSLIELFFSFFSSTVLVYEKWIVWWNRICLKFNFAFFAKTLLWISSTFVLIILETLYPVSSPVNSHYLLLFACVYSRYISKLSIQKDNLNPNYLRRDTAVQAFKYDLAPSR